jgi:hypothetical protein
LGINSASGSLSVLVYVGDKFLLECTHHVGISKKVGRHMFEIWMGLLCMFKLISFISNKFNEITKKKQKNTNTMKYKDKRIHLVGSIR